MRVCVLFLFIERTFAPLIIAYTRGQKTPCTLIHSSRVTLVCCQYVLYVLVSYRWLFAGKHFLINYTVQSAILTIRALLWRLCCCCYAIANAFFFTHRHSFAEFSIQYFFLCVQYTIVLVFVCFASRYLLFNACMCDCAHINNPSLKIRQQVLSSM